MGVADLIPGVSGGTVAFICGIYEELLESIQTLQLQSLNKIAWSFLLPLGLGISAAVLVASRFLYYLLMNFSVPLFAFFFGMILASAFFCGKKASLHQKRYWFALISGALGVFLIAGMHSSSLFGSSFIGISLAGMIAAGVMLLPGISGSYFLQLFGIYPLVLAALNDPLAPGSFKFLLTLGLGISLGFILFSRAASWLINNLHSWAYAVLIGFMLGGMRAIWPFHKEGWVLASIFSFLGFLLVILLEMRMKVKGVVQKV